MGIEKATHIIIDTREQRPWSFSRWPVKCERRKLDTGDYSLNGIECGISIERKSLDDLIGCLMGSNRDRFERELERSMDIYRFFVVVEGSWQDIAKQRYVSKIKPQSVMQSIMAFQVRYGTSFMLMDSVQRAEYTCYSLLEKFSKEVNYKLSVNQ